MEKLIPISERFSKLTPIQKKISSSKSEFNSTLHALKMSRIQQGFTQEEFSKISGIPRTSISKIENGHRNTTVLTLIKVAAALGKTLRISIKPEILEQEEQELVIPEEKVKILYNATPQVSVYSNVLSAYNKF